MHKVDVYVANQKSARFFDTSLSLQVHLWLRSQGSKKQLRQIQQVKAKDLSEYKKVVSDWSCDISQDWTVVSLKARYKADRLWYMSNIIERNLSLTRTETSWGKITCEGTDSRISPFNLEEVLTKLEETTVWKIVLVKIHKVNRLFKVDWSWQESLQAATYCKPSSSTTIKCPSCGNEYDISKCLKGQERLLKQTQKQAELLPSSEKSTKHGNR